MRIEVKTTPLLGISEIPNPALGRYREGENVSPSALGLVRRNPLKREAIIPDGSQAFLMETSEGTFFLFFEGSGQVQALNSSFSNVPITIHPDAQTYLTSPSPRENLFFSQYEIGRAFVLNRMKVILPSSSSFLVKPNIGTVVIKLGLFSSRYRIFVDEILVADLLTQDPIVGGSTQMASDFVALALAKGLAEALSVFQYGGNNSQTKYLQQDLPPGISFQLEGNVISMRRDSVAGLFPEFILSTSDSYGDRAITSFVDEVQNVSDLPPKFFNQQVVKVTGGGEGGAYFRFETTNQSPFGAGTWIECAGWHPDWKTPSHPLSEKISINSIDSKTMPVLVSFNNSEFFVAPFEWAERNVGDVLSNPFPLFVSEVDAWKDGDSVRLEVLKEKKGMNIFSYHNRLGILREDGASFSVAFEPSNFFADSALSVIDSDPVEGNVPTHEWGEKCYHAVTFREFLLIFAGDRNFIFVPREGNISPTRNRLDVGTSQGCHPWVLPSVCDDFCIFLSREGRLLGMVGNPEKTFFLDTEVPSLLRKVVSICAAKNVALIGCEEGFLASLHLERGEEYSLIWNKFSSQLFTGNFVGRILFCDDSFFVCWGTGLISFKNRITLLTSYEDRDENGMSLEYISKVVLPVVRPNFGDGPKLEHRAQIIRVIVSAKGRFNLSPFPSLVFSSEDYKIAPLDFRFPVQRDARLVSLTISNYGSREFSIEQVNFLLNLYFDSSR